LNSNFENPHGLPNDNHKTTSYDMALILKEAMKYDEFRKIMNTENYTLKKSDTLNDDIDLWNHSKLLRKNSEYYYQYTEGSKTGYTSKAGNTLASYAKKDDKELICIVLKDDGSNTYTDTKTLFEYGFNNFSYQYPLKNYDIISDIIENSGLSTRMLEYVKQLDLKYNQEYKILDLNNATYDCNFIFEDDTERGILGYITILSNNNEIQNITVSYDTSTQYAKNYIKYYQLSNITITSLKASLQNDDMKQDITIIKSIIIFILMTIIFTIIFILIILLLKSIIVKK
jgi:D-alanyl-D-alanine carboxypeptidase